MFLVSPETLFEWQGLRLLTFETCLKLWGLPSKRVWYARGIQWEMVGDFGSHDYFKYYHLRPWHYKIITAAKFSNHFSLESPCISNTFSRESPKFQVLSPPFVVNHRQQVHIIFPYCHDKYLKQNYVYSFVYVYVCIYIFTYIYIYIRKIP